MRYQKADPELKNKVVDMYKSGMKRTEISKELKLSYSFVFEVINDYKSEHPEECQEFEKELTYAEKRVPKIERLVINGKRYLDVTDTIMELNENLPTEINYEDIE